jgi:putative addiction module antidote
MNKPLKVQKIGNSAGVILPKELLEELGAEVGGTLSVTRTENGIELSLSDAEFERQMKIAREVMVRYRDALRELAK